MKREGIFLSGIKERCFVYWRLEPAKPGGRITKVPYYPKDQTRANVYLPSSKYGTLDEANDIESDGIGIVLGKPGALNNSTVLVGGIDLDTCRDPNGAIAPWAQEVRRLVQSYTEVSPSETGLKIFFVYRPEDESTLLDSMRSEFGQLHYKRSWKRGSGEHPPAIEVMLHGYFTITYELLADSPIAMEFVSIENLLRVVREVAPAFAETAASNGPKAKAPLDNSRSGQAYRLAYRIKSNGGDEDDFREALDDEGLADWAEDERQVERAWERSGADLMVELEGYGFNEDGIAKYFADSYGGILRFCHTTGSWFKWNGVYWKQEETQLAFDWARDKCREVRVENANKSTANALAKAATAAAVERFARADRAFAVTAETWDADPWLLGTPKGTLDLRTGRLRPSRQGDYITKVTAVAPQPGFDPDLDCFRWLRFLNESMDGDTEAIEFLQRWCGYCLTGETREHALLFIHGDGGNGKTVFLNTGRRILNDYAQVAPMEMFAASTFDRHPTELAMLRGARIVVAAETEEGRPWAETKIKQLTGGDMISARFMRQDFFQFQPQFKLTFIGNYKPILRNVSPANRRRFNVMPFNNVPMNKDMQLEEKLEPEWPGILAWMIQGCLDWQRHGLARPRIVVEATERYFVDQDIFGQWLEDCCIVDPKRAGTIEDLFTSWSMYAAQRGETIGSRSRGFPSTLQARGFQPIKDEFGIRGRGFRGVSLKGSDSEL